MGTGFLGSGAYIAFGGTALNADYRTLTWTNEGQIVDASAGSDANVINLVALATGNVTMTMRAPAGGTANWAALQPKQSGTLELGPEGTASGKPRSYVTAIVSSSAMTFGYNAVSEWTISWVFNSAVTNTGY